MMTDRPDVGDPIPPIALEAPDGGTTTIADFGGQPVVLFFYPKDNTPGCTTVAKDFTALADEFAGAGVALLGVSKDSAKSHQNFIRKQQLATPLASDAATDGLADALGIWVEKSMYGRTYMGMERTTYLVDRAGRIVRVWRKVKVKGHAAEVLEAARAL
jgi:peroxiredoxin Q/BCP